MPILRFKDVLPHHCEDYIEEVLNCGLSASYKYHRIDILQKLFVYRRVMKDGLVIEPLEGESAHRMAGYTRASELESNAIRRASGLAWLIRLAISGVRMR